MSGSDEKQLKNIYAKEMASSKCMKMEYLRTIFAYLYSGGRSFWFFAIKYTLNHFNLVSGAIGIINTVSATYSDYK